MAHKKAAGSAKNLRDSKPKFRWLKLFGGQPAVAGNILLRQKGDKYEAGKNTYKSNDFTIHALIDGIVTFKKKNITRFDGRKYLKTVVEVLTPEEVLSNKALKDAATKVEKPTKAPAVKKAPIAKKEAPAKAEKPAKAPVAKKETVVKVEKPAKAPVAKKAPAKKTAK